MVLGTGSHTGKTVVAAALCRILAQDGHRVAPFKAQNMSLNSFVTAGGGEISRGQVLQAQAAGVEPSTDMNPILLKPSSDEKAQVVLNGRSVGHMGAEEYHSRKHEFLPHALAALQRLRDLFDVVVLEGAGSPAEINLKEEDITNMRMAEAADARVLLVGDIDRGGVFASLLGTIQLLEDRERERVDGFVINKFRGARSLLEGGLDFLHEKTGIPVAGVIPYIRDLGLDEEDTVNLEALRARPTGREDVEIVVIHLPHISNATDFEPLAAEPGVHLRYVTRPENTGRPDALILPGSKSPSSDLSYLRDSGMDRLVVDLARRGVPVIGICGGYQMLGLEISDPGGYDSTPERVAGLGLLGVTTTMRPEKETHRVEVRAVVPIPMLGLDSHAPAFEGYEIHMGESVFPGEPAFLVSRLSSGAGSVPDGAVHPSLDVFGCYVHGLFDNALVRLGFINFLRARSGLPGVHATTDWSAYREERLDRLARTVRESVSMRAVCLMLGQAPTGLRTGRC